MHFPVIVKEGVEATVASSLAFAAAVLDRIERAAAPHPRRRDRPP